MNVIFKMSTLQLFTSVLPPDGLTPQRSTSSAAFGSLSTSSAGLRRVPRTASTPNHPRRQATVALPKRQRTTRPTTRTCRGRTWWVLAVTSLRRGEHNPVSLALASVTLSLCYSHIYHCDWEGSFFLVVAHLPYNPAAFSWVQYGVVFFSHKVFYIIYLFIYTDAAQVLARSRPGKVD